MGTITFGLISIRPGLMARPIRSLYLCSRSYRNLAGKFQEKIKENSISISSTWQTNHKCVTDQIWPGTGIKGQNACCMCPHKRLPSVLETQPPITAELPCLSAARDTNGWPNLPQLSILIVHWDGEREFIEHETRSAQRSVQHLSTT